MRSKAGRFEKRCDVTWKRFADYGYAPVALLSYRFHHLMITKVFALWWDYRDRYVQALRVRHAVNDNRKHHQ